MPPKQLKPTAGQTAFPEIEQSIEIQSYEFDLGRRRAFGGVLSPRFFNLAPDSVPSEILPYQRELADPDELANLLFRRGRQSVDGIVLNSQEYSSIARNVESLGAAAIARNRAANQLDPIPDRREARARRAAQHTLAGSESDRHYREKMESMLKFYKDEELSLNRLQKEALTPGYAHMNANELLRLANHAWTISFEGHILRAVGEHKEWDGQTKRDAQQSLRFQLFFDKQSDKLGYWKGMLKLASVYSRDKQILIKHRLRQIERIIGK